MRVLSNAPDPRFGGPLKRSLSVARGLRTHGIETVFLVPTGDDAFVSRARDDGFECLRIDQPRIRSPDKVRENFRFLFGVPHFVRSAKGTIEAHDIDVVHVNGPLNFGVARAATRSDAALAWHFNDTLTPFPLKQLSAVLATWWSDQKIVAADAVGRYFFGDTDDTRTVYAPVYLDRFDPSIYDGRENEIREELGIADGADIVGTVGNVNPAKGHEYLIDAFGQASDDAHLVIVGQKLESQQAYYERLQRKVRDLGIESRITFTGWRDDVPELLTMFDVFALPSVTEACPMVVLEAMAMECPVVATDVGGVTEQIPSEDYGWVVPPEDPTVLSTAIESALYAADERAKRASNARERVEEMFSLETCIEDHAEIYRSIVPNSS